MAYNGVNQWRELNLFYMSLFFRDQWFLFTGHLLGHSKLDFRRGRVICPLLTLCFHYLQFIKSTIVANAVTFCTPL